MGTRANANQTPQNSSFLMGISGLFIFLGLGIIAWLLYSIFNDVTLQTALEAGNNGDTILAFLDTYGILFPVIIVAVGLYLFRLGTKLLKRQISAAVWAKQVLMWLMIISAYLIAQTLLGVIAGTSDLSASIVPILGLLAVGVAFGASFWWLNHNEAYFHGLETLSSRNSRIAWNLLIPTIIILIIVAARPLEQTFIASLTDKRFASSQKTSFVGLDNYAVLLGFRIDILPQCTGGDDDAEGCPETLKTDADGATVVTYPRARDYLGEEYADLRFREVGSTDFFGSQLLISARDRDFVQAIGNTLYFAVISVTLELLLGLFVAMVINSKFAGRGLMRAAMLVPWAIPTVISARLWQIMLRDNESGFINYIYVNVLGGDRSIAWLASSDWQLPALVAVDVWKTTPFMALILLAGLQVIPSDIYEAADVDGASKVRQFFTLTLPLLRPTIAVALVFRTLDAVRVFDVFQVLLGTKKLSMATYNHLKLVSDQQFGYASAVGVMIFIIILIFTVIYVRALGVNSD